MPYLEFAVNSVLESLRSDLELIVSDDNSEDGTQSFLQGINDPRLTIVSPSTKMSMSEHWDFAQKFAVGDWQMFLGQDDMLMRGYSEAFDSLVCITTPLDIHALVARRAYVCWPPLRNKDLMPLQYWDTNEVEIRDSKNFVSKALLNEISYHSGPQMYTSSLVSKELISKIRDSQGGRLINGHPQDAYLAASILKNTSSYLWTGRPFSWVGTSDKSAGLAIISRNKKGGEDSLADSYLSSVASATEMPNRSSVDFGHGVNARYFSDALNSVWPKIWDSKPFNSRGFRLALDGNIASSSILSGVNLSASCGVMTKNEDGKAKIFLAFLWSLERVLKKVILRFVSVPLLGILKRRISLKSIRFARDAKWLHAEAVKVEAKTSNFLSGKI
jgi:hypothetical protein